MSKEPKSEAQRAFRERAKEEKRARKEAKREKKRSREEGVNKSTEPVKASEAQTDAPTEEPKKSKKSKKGKKDKKDEPQGNGEPSGKEPVESSTSNGVPLAEDDASLPKEPTKKE